jgi:hypothetical protein
MSVALPWMAETSTTYRNLKSQNICTEFSGITILREFIETAGQMLDIPNTEVRGGHQNQNDSSTT